MDPMDHASSSNRRTFAVFGNIRSSMANGRYSVGGTNPLSMRGSVTASPAAKPTFSARLQNSPSISAIASIIGQSTTSITAKRVHLFDEKTVQGFGSRFVLRDAGVLRQLWATLMGLLLLYSATVTPYRLCFVVCRSPLAAGMSEVGGVWTWGEELDRVVDLLYVVELLLNFFISYEDEQLREIFLFPAIAKRYIQEAFTLNVLCALPVLSFVDGRFRVFRLLRPAKVVSMLKRSYFFQWLLSFAFVQLWAFVGAFFVIVHIVGCGWYLVAALHDAPLLTWLALRQVWDDDSNAMVSLFDKDPFEQWVHSVYFTMLVFSTNGFGDMSARTIGECIYCMCMMISGTVAHSIVISRLIQAATTSGQRGTALRIQEERIMQFAEQVQLQRHVARVLAQKISNNPMSSGFDADKCQKMLMTDLPDPAMERMHDMLFQGQLIRNTLITACSVALSRLPPRFPLLIALLVHPLKYLPGDIVYQWSDNPWGIFLVVGGTFAYIAQPTASGGIAEVLPSTELEMNLAGGGRVAFIAMTYQDRSNLYPYMLFGGGSHFGDYELLAEKMRVCTVRCEKRGTLLILTKTDYKRMCNEFPHFTELWRAMAWRKERLRLNALAKLTKMWDLRNFATSIIQNGLRILMERAPGGGSEERWSWTSRRLEGQKRIMTPATNGGTAATVAKRSAGTRAEQLKELKREVHEVLAELSARVDGLMDGLEILNPAVRPQVGPVRSI